MVSYSQLATLTGWLKRSAIDAYMRTEEQDWEIVGGEYVNDHAGIRTTVTRPTTDGTGGGDWHTSQFLNQWILDGGKDQEHSMTLETIRPRIDKALEPWTDLPDPSTIGREVEECRVITGALSGAASVEDGVVSGAGDIAAQLDGMKDNLDSMSGQPIAQFMSKVLDKLPTTVGGLNGISVVQGAVPASEVVGLGISVVQASPGRTVSRSRPRPARQRWPLSRMA